MILLTRLNHVPLVLNSDLIEHIEVTPDTVISLTTGQTIVVLEAAEEVVRRVIGFRRSILEGMLQCPGQAHLSASPAAAEQQKDD
jgi:flagellar protein FlbD